MWKNYHITLLKNVCYILLVLCSLLHIFHFSFNLRHTKTIEINNVWKRTIAGSGAGAMKKELRSRSNSHENSQLRSKSRSHFHEQRSSGAGAVSFLQQLRSPVLVKAYSWSKFSRLCTSVCKGFLRFWLGFGC